MIEHFQVQGEELAAPGVQTPAGYYTNDLRERKDSYPPYSIMVEVPEIGLRYVSEPGQLIYCELI